MYIDSFAQVALPEVPGFLEQTIADIVAFIPGLVGALLVLLVGWLVGRTLGSAVRRLAHRSEVDRMTLRTPLGRVLGGTEEAVSSMFGTVTAWFVYALTILTAAEILAVPTLSEWIATAVSYIPAFIAGLAVIVLGFIVADFIGDAITRTRAATETEYTSWFASGVRMFLYFTAITIGLDTMGIEVELLYVFAQAVSWGIAAAIALGVGIALGWGGKDYVNANIGRWMGDARRAAPKP